MQIQFSKYHGTGNDFILLDNRDAKYNNLSKEQVAFLCHRRFGIGADGLMLVEPTQDADFKMVYYNSDGNTSSMCGNGGRCITAFAQSLGIIKSKTTFLAIDGLHDAYFTNGEVSLKMIDVNQVLHHNDDFVLNTGSPHYVKFVDDVDAIDVFKMGREIRYSEAFKTEGINVNFVQTHQQGIKVRTYERGVEDETYSCGTGVVASAIVASQVKLNRIKHIKISTPGGLLEVRFDIGIENHFHDIWLTGKAEKVYDGEIEVR
jgi:diaminopimelate epimerase